MSSEIESKHLAMNVCQNLIQGKHSQDTMEQVKYSVWYRRIQPKIRPNLAWKALSLVALYLASRA